MVVSDLELLRSFEPVLRLTQGEFFVPTNVADYVRHSRLYRLGLDAEATCVAETGTLDLDLLAEFGRQLEGPGYSLSAMQLSPRAWGRLRARFRSQRPHFRAGSRMAEVGLLGRLIDTVSRLSLLVRGAVPGGSALAALDTQNAHLDPERPHYYGRVLRDGDWLVLQYWFFYAFNNWRSGFSGVNEHEADWEQVTIYLDGSGAVGDDGLPPARWVVFSAHDETGDDLRRRWDDPDLGLVDGRHPIVYAGAGSHSGAYLPGDYLITVAPPTLGGVVPFVRRVAKILTPWTRAAQGSGLGIPYIDYARGDGLSIGPAQELPWTPAVIGDHTSWVRDYRGLWGHDTRDRLGGERGPAGPRYERSAVVRDSWADPVGWAGLAKVAPNPDCELSAVAERIATIDLELADIDVDVVERGSALTERAAGLPADAPGVRSLAPAEEELTATKQRAVRLRDERAHLERVQRDGVPVVGPHAHLRHRRVPISESERRRARLLTIWSVVSTPLMLALLAFLLSPNDIERPSVSVAMVLMLLSVEAFVRGYFLSFLGRVLLVLVVVEAVVGVYENWQVVLSLLLAVSAVVLLLVNVRDAWRR